MRLTLRSMSFDKCTLGKLTVDGEPFCDVLENPWLDNKVMISCIPAGYYRLMPHMSPKYGECYALHGKGVGIKDEARTFILIHAGNVEWDTAGCLLLGTGIGVVHSQVAVLNSKKTVKSLMDILDGFEHDIRIYRD